MSNTEIPAEVLKELETDAQAAGFTAKRIDAKNSRWAYLRRCLALGRKYRDVISSSSAS